MKKLHELSNKEARNLIIALSAELKILADDDLKAMLKEFNDARKNNDSDLSPIDIIQQLADFILIKNEESFWRILAAIMQCTAEQVQEMNNVETLEAVIGFFSVDQYRKLFQSVITSVTKK